MTFKEYLQKINRFAQNNPEYLNLEVYYSIDDEGNDYKPVIYGPSISETWAKRQPSIVVIN